MSWLRIATVEGSGSKDYNVSREMGDGTMAMTWGCSCPAWTKGKNAQSGRTDCKHTKWVKEYILTGVNPSDRAITLETDAQAQSIIAAFRLAEKIKAKSR